MRTQAKTSVGKRLRHIREQRGLTLDQLADKARVSKSFLWGVEQDKTGISGERLRDSIAIAFI